MVLPSFSGPNRRGGGRARISWPKALPFIYVEVDGMEAPCSADQEGVVSHAWVETVRAAWAAGDFL
jgi:hypothetical protein